MTVDVGARAELRCTVSGGNVGQGQPSRAWYKDGHLLAGASHQTLVVEHVQREDAGMYQCVARADNDDSAQAASQLLLGGMLLYSVQCTGRYWPLHALKTLAYSCSLSRGRLRSGG